MRLFKLLILAFLLCGCDEVSPKAKISEDSTDGDTASGFSGLYVKDGKGGLFNNVKWYFYSLENHIVWPLFDVYSIKTPSAVYRLQITNYYKENTDDVAGYFTIRVKSESNDTSVAVEAPGCGNPFTNPDFDACSKDPEQNVFTYLDLETLTAKQMSDAVAMTEPDWDIAFRGTDVKLNSGLSGPSTVVGALAHRFPFFFENGSSTPSTAAVMDVGLKTQAIATFDQNISNPVVSYYLPDGIDRVIHESYWYFTNPDGTRVAQDQNWWVVKSHDGAYFAKIRIAGIEDSAIDTALLESGYTTQLKLEWHIQARDQTAFSTSIQIMDVDVSTSQKTISLCLNLERATSGKCSSSDPQWDLKLVGANVFKAGVWTRDWRFFTSGGAIGPLSPEDAAKILSGTLTVR